MCVCVSGGGGGVHKLSELCTNIHFGHVKTADIVLKSIKLACCGSSKLVPVMSSGTLTQMTDLRYFSPDVTGTSYSLKPY